MAKQIYYVQSCDEWESRDSMRLELITTSAKKLKDFISKKIKAGDFEYNDPEQSADNQAGMFRRDFEAETRDVISARLRYACFSYAYDGEEI